MIEKKPKGQSPEKLEEITHLRELGHTYQEIAERYNVRVQTVRNWLTQANKNKKYMFKKDKTKIEFMLDYLDIDIQDKKSIQRQCDQIMITLAQGGIKPHEAKLMATGVMWYFEGLLAKIEAKYEVK